MAVLKMTTPSHIGLAGTGISGGFTLLGFLEYATPVMQAISLLIGIAVGVVTFLYYYRKIKRGE